MHTNLAGLLALIHNGPHVAPFRCIERTYRMYKASTVFSIGQTIQEMLTGKLGLSLVECQWMAKMPHEELASPH